MSGLAHNNSLSSALVRLDMREAQADRLWALMTTSLGRWEGADGLDYWIAPLN